MKTTIARATIGFLMGLILGLIVSVAFDLSLGALLQSVLGIAGG